jgi:tetratricopeptide (TPR) repeat protein
MRIGRLIIAAGVFAAAPLGAQTVAEHVAAGVAAREARDGAGALKHFQAALAQDSMDYQANWEAALALIDLGKATPDDVKSPARDSLYALAEVYARRAVTANPSDAEGHFALANAIGRASLTKSKKERVQRASEIRTEALRAIQLNPRHDGAYHVLGRWNAEIMRLSGAARFFAKNFLGGDVLNQASWEGAVSNMEKAVELNPRRIYHRLDLAEVYVDRGRFSDARTQLQRIESLPVSDPLDPTYKQDAAQLLKKIENRKDS